MSIRNLDRMFRPASITVIGADEDQTNPATRAMRNLLDGRFAGPILPVQAKHRSIAGVLCYREISALPLAPDLALISAPAEALPGLIDELGQGGCRAAVILPAAGADCVPDFALGDIAPALLDAAKPFGLRILGPATGGFQVPDLKLNASIGEQPARPGRLAFVSTSMALAATVLDWAQGHEIGFSHIVALGESIDIDCADLLDYLGADSATHAILCYIEEVKAARKFLSAARGAARNKPVLAIKAQLAEDEPWDAETSTRAAERDEIYRAAFRRAGIIRVGSVPELFEAVETLSSSPKVPGSRLALLTNGRGPAAMAVNHLLTQGVGLAVLDTSTRGKLRELAAAGSNPIDLGPSVTAQRYRAALKALLTDPGSDSVLALLAPHSGNVPTAIADALIAELATSEEVARRKSVLPCWLGGESTAPARRRFREAGLPVYETPESAVRGFFHLVEHRRTQELLLQTPPAVPTGFNPDRDTARHLIGAAVEAGRDMLGEIETKALLGAFGIAVVPTLIAATDDAAAGAASQLGYPVALKILSPDVRHKTLVGGVVLDLEKPRAVRRAARAMRERVRTWMPEARIDGFIVQKMARQAGALELFLGIVQDPTFGPLIRFGRGGVGAEPHRDRATALPPLNMGLAQELIARAPIAAVPPGVRQTLALTLVQVSQMIIDLPELRELSIDPLVVHAEGVAALDAQVRAAPVTRSDRERLAISPYPQDLAEEVRLRSGRTVLLRPIRPEDEPAHMTFFHALNPEDVRWRFFGFVRDLSHAQMARFTQIDYDREMAFIATAPNATGEPETLGVVRTVTDSANQRAEFAIIVRSDMKGQRLGSALFDKMIRYTRARRTPLLSGQLLAENQPMRQFLAGFGFKLHALPEDLQVMEATLDLQIGPERTDSA